MRHVSRIVFLFALAVGCASAKPSVKVVLPVKAVPPEFISYEDAQAALAAEAEVLAAKTLLNQKQLAWQHMRNLLITKWGIDPDLGQGWDVQPDGAFKIRREASPTSKK